MERKNILIAIMIFSFLGVIIAGMLTAAKYSDSIALLCGQDIDNSCNTVQNSPYSYLINEKKNDGSEFKIPLTLAGIIFYLILIALAYRVYSNEKNKKKTSDKLKYSLFVIGIFGVLFSAAFTWIQAFLIEAFCTYCLISALDTVIIAIMIGLITFRK